MIRLLRFLLWGDGHSHHWETIAHGPIMRDDGAKIGSFYECRCSTCGTIRQFNCIA